MSAGCAEMREPRKIGDFIDFGETGDSPDALIFYFQHNKFGGFSKARTYGLGERIPFRFLGPRNASAYSATCSGVSKYLS